MSHGYTNTPLETLLTYSLFLNQLCNIDVLVIEILMCCVQNQLQSQDISNVEGNRRMLYETSSSRASPPVTYSPLPYPPGATIP